MPTGDWEPTSGDEVCPDCGGPIQSYRRQVSWTMFVPRSWGEDEEYETATRWEYKWECYDCGYGDFEPACY